MEEPGCVLEPRRRNYWWLLMLIGVAISFWALGSVPNPRRQFTQEEQLTARHHGTVAQAALVTAAVSFVMWVRPFVKAVWQFLFSRESAR